MITTLTQQPNALRSAEQLRDISSRFKTPSHERGVCNAAVDQDLLFAWLAHGDDAHREWLRNAIAAFFAGGKWPDPTGMSALEAERTACQTAQRQLADLQELQAKSGLAHRKSVQEAVAVAAEREACAELMEQQHTWITNVAASALIRARGTPCS